MVYYRMLSLHFLFYFLSLHFLNESCLSDFRLMPYVHYCVCVCVCVFITLKMLTNIFCKLLKAGPSENDTDFYLFIILFNFIFLFLILNLSGQAVIQYLCVQHIWNIRINKI